MLNVRLFITPFVQQSCQVLPLISGGVISKLIHIYVRSTARTTLNDMTGWCKRHGNECYTCVCVSVLAYRDCNADGTWWLNPQNKTWSNYTACINIAELTVGTDHLYIYLFSALHVVIIYDIVHGFNCLFASPSSFAVTVVVVVVVAPPPPPMVLSCICCPRKARPSLTLCSALPHKAHMQVTHQHV